MPIAYAFQPMEEMKDLIAIVVGASPLAEDVRRRLVQRRVDPAGVAGHLRGLRRRLAAAPAAMVVLFVAVDRATIRRHGRSLRKLLDDRPGFRPGVACIGLLEDRSLNAAAAALGCDVYVGTAAAAMRSMATFDRRRRAAAARGSVNRMRAVAKREADRRPAADASQCAEQSSISDRSATAK